MKLWLKDGPLTIDSADGIYLKDIDGNIYMDGVSSLWVNVHGHRHAHIDAAIKKQIDKVSHSTLLGLSNTPANELANRLVRIAPTGLKKVFYSDNGSTAVEIAIKMAYQYWQNTGHKKKTQLVHLSNSYHGDTLGSVSVGGIDLFHKVYRKLILKTIALKSHGWQAVDELEKLFEKKGDGIAALVVEPLIQGAAGMLVWPEGTFRKMRELTKKYNVFLIADEVATGFGRTGKMFACQHEGVSPDFLCLAKGITGGYLPLAATLTTQKVFDGFLFDHKEQKTFFHGHTYTGNPLACAAALANLEVFQKERTLVKLGPKIKFLAKKLKMFYNLPSVAEVRQKGFMVGIDLKGRFEDRVGAKVCQAVRKYGVILRPLGNVIVLMPPLSITIEELDYLLMATYRAIEEYEK
jgi:adenosylmethionine-8-amino-7-oxononanoate aminotransferase